MSALGHEPSFAIAQILADERPLTDVNRSLDQVYRNAAPLNVSSYQQQSLDTTCLEGRQSANWGRSSTDRFKKIISTGYRSISRIAHLSRLKHLFANGFCKLFVEGLERHVNFANY